MDKKSVERYRSSISQGKKIAYPKTADLFYVGAKINENVKDKFLYKIPAEWKHFDAVICEPIGVSKPKFMKVLKRGFKKRGNLHITPT